jgi:hypothetical protein
MGVAFEGVGTSQLSGVDWGQHSQFRKMGVGAAFSIYATAAGS